VTSLLLAMVCIEHDVASAQSSPQFRAGVDVVRLDVSVLDRNRKPIRGLTAADFTVLEDGKPQPVVAFSAIDMADTFEPAAGWMRDVGSDVVTNQLDVQRVVVIVMDDGITEGDPGTGKAARQIARAVIERLSPNDLGAVVFTFHGRSQNFTRDKRQLIAAAETFLPKAIAAPGRMTAAANARGTMAIAGPPLGCVMPGGGPNCLTRTLKTVAGALEDTPAGRKTIVLISSGVPYNFSMENLEAGHDLDDLRMTFRSLQLANVNVYPFDPTGLTGEGIVALRLDGLRIFADHTGGRATVATNTPWAQVPQVFTENSSYYLLGIRPANDANDGRFRRITIRVRRPDAEVRTRAGYYAPNATRRARAKGPVAPISGLDKAFGAALPSGTLPLEVTAAPFAFGDGKQAVVVVTTAVRRPVTEQVTIEKLDVRTAAFDYGETKERAAHRQTAEVTLRPTANGERRFELQSRLTVKPGRYEIRVAAESAGSSGGVFTQLDVPDFSKTRLTISGLVLGRPRSGSDDVLTDLLPILPTAARVFVPSVPITAFLRVYQGGRGALAAVQLHARIVDAGSQAVFEETTMLDANRFQAGRSAEYRLELPLARLGEGERLLTIDVTDTKNTVRREVRFAVKTTPSTGGTEWEP
jgi:VWFA-related protein